MTWQGPRARAVRAAAGPFVAPVAAFVVLLVVAIVSLNLVTGDLTLPGGPNDPGEDPGNGGPIGPPRTPAPSNVVVVDPRTEVPGSIVYVKAGNLWIQTGDRAVQLTDGGRDAMPAWSPDGAWIYFVRTRPETGRWPVSGQVRTFEMEVPTLMRVQADGSGAEALLDGLLRNGANRWFFWIRQPAPSPDGLTVALLSDGPDPTDRNVVLQLFDLATGAMTPVNASEQAPLGHQDPAWRPDGGWLTYVRNGREGARGAPTIQRHNLESDRSSSLTGSGYTSPSWSPDGRFLAVTKTDAFGTDVVVLDGQTGALVLPLTNDERSWAPAWSPAGDAVAYLHRNGEVVDLKLVRLADSGPDWTVAEVLDLTLLSDLDGTSRPTWWVAPQDLPPPAATPTPATTPVGTPIASGAPAASSAAGGLP
jgi:dipeptidyl aminopeptidase/acylaminoacyl peptidase